MIRRLTASFIILAAICGCSQVSSSKYAEVSETLRTDREAMKAATEECREGFDKAPLTKRQSYAALAGVSVARAPSVVCQRIFRAIASGRLSHKEYVAADGNYARWIEIIRG